MLQFEITLKNSKIKSYRFIALMIVIFNLFIFIYLLFFDKYFYDAAASFFLIAVYFFSRFYVSKKNKTGFYMDRLSFFILAGSWFALRNYPLVTACVLMGILYHFSLQKIQFVFNSTLIRKINFPAVEYQWSQMDNVLLRDDILTLDFNNNKLIQWEIENEKNIIENEFNEFAQLQLAKYSHAEETLYLN